MQRVNINPATVPLPPNDLFCNAVRLDVGDGALLFVSGQVAVDEDGKLVGPGDMAAQAEYIFDVLQKILADQGATFADVVNIRTHLTDISLIRDYGMVRRSYFEGAQPTSTTVEVSRLFVPGALIEVDITAAIPGQRPTA